MNYAKKVIDKLDEAIARFDPNMPGDLVPYYALLVLTTGESTTLENVHDAWALWRLETRPGDPDLVPFDLVAPEVQVIDRPYMEAIRDVAREVSQ